LVTIIIPVLNEADVIKITANKVTEAFLRENIDFELLFIDDGSTDNTWQIIEEIVQQSEYILGIKLSRNFGKEGAIFAGLDHSQKDCVIIMDGDLQHPPEVAVQMYKLWVTGNYQIVEAVKKERQRESAIQRLGAKFYYSALKRLSGIALENASDFKLLDKQVVDVLTKMPERHTFFRAMTGWTGYSTMYLPYDVADRVGGTTKFNAMKLFKLAIDSIASYSSLPLHGVTLIGVVFCVFSVIMAAHTLYRFLLGHSLEGFTTVILLLLLIGGILMLSLGTIGIYIAKIYNEIKSRPRYIIAKKAENSYSGK